MNKNDFKFPTPYPLGYVAFIDVLGFSDLVQKNQNTQLEAYFQTIINILGELKESSTGLQSLSISDSIILISPDTQAGLKLIIRAVRKIQRKLLFKNILIRGAISHGEVFFDDVQNVIAGKGYIRAYLLEREAVYPRVIIDPLIMTILKTDRIGIIEMMNRSQDFNSHSNYIFQHNRYTDLSNDAIFIDYAYALAEDDTKVSGIIGKVYLNIRKNLYSDQKHYSKYNWLRNYFLGCINQSIQLTSDNKKIKALKDWTQKFQRLQCCHYSIKKA